MTANSAVQRRLGNAEMTKVFETLTKPGHVGLRESPFWHGHSDPILARPKEGVFIFTSVSVGRGHTHVAVKIPPKSFPYLMKAMLDTSEKATIAAFVTALKHA
jgi:hypothetical protein